MLLDVAQAYGLSPVWEASTGGGEYSSACPSCGGNDRFRLQPNRQQKNCNGRYFCRQCLKKGDTIQFCIEFLNDTYPEACQRLGISPDGVKTIGSIIRIPQSFAPTKLIMPADLWVSKATAFVNWCHSKILKDATRIIALTKRGIPPTAVKRYKIGFCPETFFREKPEWGMIDDGKKLWIPAGLVIPVFDDQNSLIRVKIRRIDYKDGDEIPKYIAISGSANGLNFIGDKLARVGIAVESELDAFMLHYQLDQTVFTIGTGSCTKNPDELTHDIVSQCKKIFIAYDNDDGGQQMWAKWKKLYRHAVPALSPLGKDIGEAAEQGLDIKEWFSNISLIRR